MNIIVCIKQVPDTGEVKIDPETNNLVREGVPSIINPFDENAMELALQLRERYGGKVTALSMGPIQATSALEYCLGMGADDAVLVSDRIVAGSDTLATGYVLSKVIFSMRYDLILCGSEAIDGCTGQVGPSIAEYLDIPQFTYVNRLDVDGGKLIVQRDAGRVLEQYEATLPALACVLKTINEPRPSAKTEAKVRVLSAAEAGLEKTLVGNSGSPTRVVKIRMSDARSKSYVVIDDTLDWEGRIQMIIDGGITKKDKVNLWRGKPEELAQRILTHAEFARYVG